MRTSTSNNRPIRMDQLLIPFSFASTSVYSTCAEVFVRPSFRSARNRKCRIMRVIAGKYRSRPLRSLRGMDIRPTSDRLRETLFDVLTAGNPGALEGTVWLDIFAGTGAVGIGARSRGAKQVYFVESSKPAAELIRSNLESLGVT